MTLRRPHRLRWLHLVALSITLGWWQPVPAVQAQDMLVPIENQAEIFNYIFKLNLTIRDQAPIVVWVVYNDASAPATVRRIAEAFEKQQFDVTTIHVDALMKRNTIPAQALYLAPGVNSIGDVSERYRVLSITGVPHLVESNRASIGLNSRNDRAGVLANLIKLRGESQEMSSRFLNLKIVQLIQ